jgi:hypothetical protein
MVAGVGRLTGLARAAAMTGARLKVIRLYSRYDVRAGTMPRFVPSGLLDRFQGVAREAARHVNCQQFAGDDR